LSSLGANNETYVLEGQVELAGAIKGFGIELEGCTLISLDQNNEWIQLKDIQQLRLLKLRQLLIPARFRDDGMLIRYEFQYDSPMRRLYKLASLLPTANSIWNIRSTHTVQAHHYTTPPIRHLSAPVDTESVFNFALFEGPSQMLPFVSSHPEIYSANERRYSVWNQQVQYSIPPHPRRWFFRPLYRYNWLIPVNKNTASKLPVVAWPMPLGETRTRYEEVMRRLVDSTNECVKKKSEASFFVLYTHGLSAGGAERQWCNLAIGLKAIGKRVILVVDSLEGVNGHYLDMVRKGGVEILDTSKQRELGRLNFMTDFQYHPLFDPAVYPVADQVGRLASVLDRLKPDAVVAQLDSTNITAGVAALLTDIPRIVLSFRNYNPSHFDYIDSPWMLSAYQELIRSNRIVLTGNSRLGNMDYAQWLGLDAQRIHILKNSYEPDGIEILSGPEKDAFRASLQIAPESKIIFGAFRLAREKNPHLFVKTCEIVLARHPNAIALLCGEGSMHDELAKRIEHSGLTNRVRLMGRRSDIWKLLSVADVLLLTSDKEGTPNIVKEALMLHCPVVSTACGAVPEMIQEDVHGHLAAPGDVEKLSTFVEKVLYDTEHRAHLVRSMPTSSELFSPQDKAKLLLSILDGTFR
jgi:glycosyltransferase involved in cell wall biosynthesis